MDVKYTIAVDGMGGDNAPYEIVLGAVNAVKARNDIKVILTGDEPTLKKTLEDIGYTGDAIEIVHCTEVIEMAEHPVNAIKKKKDSSMVVGMTMLKEKKVDAFLSSGNSGALLAGGLFVVGRIKGVERAPFAPIFPTAKGRSLIVDSGANVDARASHLVQFAKMGTIYMRDVVGVKNPTVAIVNCGAEEEKGNSLVKETFPLLKECKDINFIGSVEARDIPDGYADIIVCDGFVGNAILKLYEGLAKTLVNLIKEGLKSTFVSKIGAALALPALKKTLKVFDVAENGGAPLLGLQGVVVKTHGSAKHPEIENAIYQCVSFNEEDICGKIAANLVVDK